MATVSNQAELRAAITNMDPDILVTQSFGLTSPVTISYAVKISGWPGVSLKWLNPTATARDMFFIAAAGNLEISSIILDGDMRDGTLVHIYGGAFTMNGDGCTLTGVKSTTAQNAVKIAAINSTAGGTFHMSGGAITGIDSADAVFNWGGTVIMCNEAMIINNSSAGISMGKPISGGARPQLTMAGNSGIMYNSSKDVGGAGILTESDVVMGVREVDTPCVKKNYSPYQAGAWFFSDNCTLTMSCGAKIADNSAAGLAGGIGARDTQITMRGNSMISGNKTSLSGGGLFITGDTTVILEENAEITKNEAFQNGAGIFMQSGAKLEMRGNSSVNKNKCENGAGIYVSVGAEASIGMRNTSPTVHMNEAAGIGGGIFISPGGRVNLMGYSVVSGNIAKEGAGIYKTGGLNVSGSPIVADGLFFDDLNPGAITSGETVTVAHELSANTHITPLAIEDEAAANNISGVIRREGELRQVYTDNVPVIADTLTSEAEILLEASGYVTPENAPLVIGDKGEECSPLGETDIAAWQIPRGFGPGYKVILNTPLDQVLIDIRTFNITYLNLFGAENPNPVFFTVKDLPITLLEPGERDGYAFDGWYDYEGNPVTEITSEMAGDLVFSAAWVKTKLLWLDFDGNAPCVTNVPEKILVEDWDIITIPSTIPKKPRHCFAGWNTKPDGTGMVVLPHSLFRIEEESEILYAQWKPFCCGAAIRCVVEAGIELYCPKKPKF